MNDPARSKYDDLLDELLVRTDAKAVCLIVFEGNKGNGMGMKLHDSFALDPNSRHLMAAALRGVAASIEHIGLLGVPHRGDIVPSYTCPRCKRRSYHPKDIENKYCGACHKFEDGP